MEFFSILFLVVTVQPTANCTTGTCRLSSERSVLSAEQSTTDRVEFHLPSFPAPGKPVARCAVFPNDRKMMDKLIYCQHLISFSLKLKENQKWQVIF